METKKLRQPTIRLAKDEIEYIIKNYKKMRYKEIADYIGCDISTVKKTLVRYECKLKNRIWSIDDYRYLYFNYKRLGAKRMALRFDCSVANIYTRMRFVRMRKLFE